MLSIVDTPNIGKDEDYPKEAVMPISGFILMYSITSRSSFERVEELRNKILSCKHETKVCPHFVV